MGRERQCTHCGLRFAPDRRNERHQRYCGAAPCKAASKKASQAKWLENNPGYHCGREAVARVQAWRKAHPGYSWSKPDSLRNAPTPAEVMAPPQISCNAPETSPGIPLQELLASQPIVLVGLIAHIWGSALQEDIASALTRLIQLGQDIRGGEHEYSEADSEPGTPAPGTRAFQLDRSPPGAGARHREG
jgi:hypothetical protein